MLPFGPFYCQLFAAPGSHASAQAHAMKTPAGREVLHDYNYFVPALCGAWVSCQHTSPRYEDPGGTGKRGRKFQIAAVG